MTLTVPKVWADQEALRYDDLNLVASTIYNKFGSILGSDLDSAAGITAGQMTDRYSVSRYTLPILPITQGATLATPAEYTMDATTTRQNWWEIVAKQGQEGWLCAIQFHVLGISNNGTDPLVQLRKNGSIISQAMTLDTSDQLYRIQNNNPIDAPLTALANGDTLEVYLGGAITADMRGLLMTVVEKWRMVS